MQHSRKGRSTLPTPGDLREITDRAWVALNEYRSDTDERRFIAKYGTAIVWLEPKEDGSGHLQITTLDLARMKNLLADVAQWSSGDSIVPPPESVARNMLVDRWGHGLGQVERITDVPVMAPDGSIHEAPGYDAASRCFYAPAPGLEVPSVPSEPSAVDIEKARDTLHSLVGEFPWVSPSEYAHAIAFGLLPFVRVLIDGPTPIHLFEAPTPGTGKSLLVEVLAIPALGPRPVAFMAEGEHADEWRKRITATLRHAPAFFVIDNISRPLDSGALASAITAGVVEDRILGTSNTVTIPIRCAIGVTGNNPTLSREMVRRSIRIRLDSGLEEPHSRPADRFTHPDLRAWARARRGELVWALLTLSRAWVYAGKPGPDKHLGSFESWTHTIGGILHVAGINGFLGNINEFRAAVEDTVDGDFLRLLQDRFGPSEFMSQAACDAAGERDPQQMGVRLRDLVDRPIDGLVLRKGKAGATGGKKWRISDGTEVA